MTAESPNYFAHPSSFVDQPCEIGAGTQIWHFCHIMANCTIGEECRLGQNVFVAAGTVIGARTKIQNNVSVYEGVKLEEDVFCGPSCVFTNVRTPRSQVKAETYESTLVRRGATLGANSTVVCGVTIGMHAFISAGAVVTHDVPSYALMMGVPAVQKGWMGRHGFRLKAQGPDLFVCPETGWRYEPAQSGSLRCIDWPEDKPLTV